jgi:hypothetical protein
LKQEKEASFEKREKKETVVQNVHSDSKTSVVSRYERPGYPVICCLFVFDTKKVGLRKSQLLGLHLAAFPLNASF